jgi:hypothetical protein
MYGPYTQPSSESMNASNPDAEEVARTQAQTEAQTSRSAVGDFAGLIPAWYPGKDCFPSILIRPRISGHLPQLPTYLQ